MKIRIEYSQRAIIVLMIVAFISSVQAATFTVNTTLDTLDVNEGNGICADASGNCSLRAAISETNTLSLSGGNSTHTITLPAGIYTLTITGVNNESGNLSGDLNISNPSNLTINGSSARTTIIQAGTIKSTDGTDGNGIDRVFRILGTLTKLSLNYLTVRNGKTASSGGGIFHQEGLLTISNSAIVDNYGFNGGGISSSNQANISNSLIAGNTAGRAGGGFFNFNAPAVSSFTNITISGNRAISSGGGIFNNGGDLIVTNCTISQNVTNTNSNFVAGGIDRNNLTGALTSLRNTIVTNNFIAASLPRDTYGTIISGGTNLIGDAGLSTGWIGTDLLNNSSANLGTLQDNGGETNTHALLSGSSAIGAGQGCVILILCSNFNAPINVFTDQRGITRAGHPMDIGAYSYIASTAASAGINGRVVTANGRGIRNVRVSLTNQNGETRFTVTNSFGYYRFEEVQVGEFYVIQANSKRYQFAPQTVNLVESLDGVNFTPLDEAAKSPFGEP